MTRGRFVSLILLYIACAAAAAVLIASRFSANPVSSTPFETVSEAVLASVDLDTMQEGNNQMVKRLYGFDPASVGDVLLYYPLSNMGAEELLLVRMEDPDGSTETVTDGIRARVSSQESSFDGYAPEQYAMVEKSITDVQGNYVLFISSADPSVTDEAFRQSVGAGAASGSGLFSRVQDAVTGQDSSDSAAAGSSVYADDLTPGTEGEEGSTE